MAKPAKSYGAASIKVLQDMEAARNRPTIYFGGTDEKAQEIAYKENTDNARDEAIASKTYHVGIEVDGDYLTVCDWGRGIPVEEHPETGKSTLETVFTKLNAGGKFSEGEDSAYEDTIGTFGVGASATCAVSEVFECWTWRNKNWWHFRAEKGKVIVGCEKVKKPAHWFESLDCSTIVRCKLDPTVFKESGTFKIDDAGIEKSARLSAYLNAGVQYDFYYKGKLESKFLFKDGPIGLLNEMIAEDNLHLKGDPINVKQNGVDLVLGWTEHPEFKVQSFASSSPTTNGGTHLEGLKRAIDDALGKYASAKQRKEYTLDSALAGVVGILNIDISAPEFGGATKDKLKSKAANERVYQVAFPLVAKFFSKNKDVATKAIENAIRLTAADARHAENRAAATGMKASKRGKDNLPVPPVFVRADCKVSERELYVVEGESASGTAKACRDKQCQEVLALSGKFVNAVRNRAKALANEHIRNLLSCIGFIPGQDFENTRRIDKLILMPDADDDGAHIALLISAVLEVFVPEMLFEKRVFTVNAGLFNTFWRGQQRFGRSRADLYSQFPDMPRSQLISRLKGWGEADVKMLRPVAFDYKTRELLLVPAPTDKEREYFRSLMGKDSEIKREVLGI